MSPQADFDGFPKGGPAFLAELARHNNRDWFVENKARFDRLLLDPARRFVSAMGPRLAELSPHLIADPRINRSIFRLNRDTRFSKDKLPYKTHLGLWFWEGFGPRMECSGFYFHLEAETILLGAGVYLFSPRLLAEFRRSVDDAQTGPALARAVAQAAAAGPYQLGGRHYKRVPRGFEPDHPRADLLKHNGFYLGLSGPAAPMAHSAELIDYCLENYRNTLPVHQWLVEMIDRANAEGPGDWGF